MSRQQLNAASRYFFERILPAATQGKRLSQLSGSPENVQVLMGAYRKHTGGPIQRFGRTITPEFTLKVGNSPLALQDNIPNLGDAPVAADALDQPLCWMRFAADAKVDDQAAIQDLMGDLDTYASRTFDLAGVAVQLQQDAAVPPNSSQWATAIQANRAALPDNLSTLTAVPEPFRTVAPDLLSFKLILGHFFTYDAAGAYYPKWTGTGRRIPEDLSEKYKEENVRELKLERHELYVYMLVPKSLFTTQAAEAHDYREAIVRLDPSGEDETPFLATLVHSVYRRVETKVPFYDFVVFESEDGIGLPIPPDVRPKISSSVAQFLISVPAGAEDRARFFHESTHVVEGEPPLVHLTATVSGEPEMPPGVDMEVAEGGMVAAVMSPLDKIADIAAMPQVRYLDLAARPARPYMDLVRTAIRYDELRAKQAAGKQDGQGVLVGIIDTGIDGSHPAFLDASGNTRIVAVWEQDAGAKGNANSPKAKHPGNNAYKMFDFGRERTGADVAGSTDKNTGHGAGHGTHVTGIAAGRQVTNPAGNVPSGIASNAQIVVVKAIGANQGRTDLGLAYIFQKAKELSKPCVVNMSFGHQHHAHDGTDDLARSLTRQIRNAAGNYLPGRILVAAAGNDRTDAHHVGSRLAPSASTTIRFSSIPATGTAAQISDLSVWIKGTKTGPKPNLRVTAQHIPTGWSTGALTPTKAVLSATVPGSGGLRINMVYGDRDIHNKDFNLEIGFNRPAAGALEEWRIVIANASKIPLDLHAWVLEPLRGRLRGLVAEDNISMVGSPGSARDVISVACSVTRLEWPDRDAAAILRNFGQTRLGDISNFSSQGPLRSCSEREITLFGLSIDQSHDAVTITAPGSATLAARASNVAIPPGSTARQNSINDLCWMMQGTSMAAPVITGLVACLLAESPTLTQEQVRTLIEGAGRMPDPAATNFNPGAPDVEDWGKGLILAPALKP